MTKREEEDMKRYVDNSEGIKRAETERIKAIEAMRQEVELFISNIPYNILAKDLVEFFSNKLRDLGIHSS